MKFQDLIDGLLSMGGQFENCGEYQLYKYRTVLFLGISFLELKWRKSEFF